MSSSPTKRFIVPAKRVKEPIDMPSVDKLLAEALAIIESEIYKLKVVAAGTSRGLSLEQAKLMQSYMRALVELSKEERERSKSQDLSELSDEELLELLEKLKLKREAASKVASETVSKVATSAAPNTNPKPTRNE